MFLFLRALRYRVVSYVSCDLSSSDFDHLQGRQVVNTVYPVEVTTFIKYCR